MLNDFVPITLKYPRGEGIKVIPISDVHLGALECLEGEWSKFIEDVKEDESIRLILNGDLINNATKSSKSNVYDEVYSPRKQKDKIAEYLAPIKDRIIACNEGNHEYRSARETDEYINYDVCCRLGIEDIYRPNACFIIVRFDEFSGRRLAGKDRPTYTLCATHGAGTTIKRFQDFATSIDNLDCLIVGHTHKPIIVKDKKLFIDTHNNKISYKQYHTCVAGSWLEYGGYAMRAMYRPGANGLQTINLSGDHKQISITQY